MGIRLDISDGLGNQLLEGGAFTWDIFNEIEDCETINKYRDECENKNCFMCDCSDSNYTKLTYEELLKINKEVLFKNTNIIHAFCLKTDDCEFKNPCNLDCLIDNHRDSIVLNFS